MQYAEDRALRETLYRASATRASEFGKAEWDNTPLIARILELRKEDAALLGYANFAEVSLVPKMAQTPAQVLDFLRRPGRAARGPSPSGTSRSCAHSPRSGARPRQARVLGRRVTPRRSCARSATRSPTRR